MFLKKLWKNVWIRIISYSSLLYGIYEGNMIFLIVVLSWLLLCMELQIKINSSLMETLRIIINATKKLWDKGMIYEKELLDKWSKED